ncbi:hypothetical protein EDE09_12479 [Neorhizobium sp. S3-V5DH]|nr:hypothetical protein EDE09_12479 [Neorhizobium sp. S3-V5DH]
MCPKKPKIQKADTVIAPAPAPAPTQLAPVLNEATKATASEGASSNIARKGRSSLVIPLTNTRQTGVNIPR